MGEEAEVNTQEEQQKLTEVLDELLKSGASEAEIYTKIEEYKEKFADYGRDRRSAIEFHLRNIERLLMPTQTTSVDNIGNTSARRIDPFWERGNRNENTLEVSHVAPVAIVAPPPPVAGMTVAPQGTPHHNQAGRLHTEQSMDQDSSPDSMFNNSLQSLSEKLDDEAIDFLTSINKQPQK